ncbi:MAG: MFS transporter [Verrucomicrobia bacterium]|nr:MFS transporter [Verrucomicrobiota bacterium]
MVDGAGFGLWAGHIPALKERFGLNGLQVSALLFGLVVGAVVAMPLAGHAVARCGSRLLCRVTSLAYCASLLPVALSPTGWWLGLAVALFGAAKGAMDVSINAQAVAVEAAWAKPIMASFQACWSVGGMCGAGFAALALQVGSGATVNLALGAGALLAASVPTYGHLLPDGQAPGAASKAFRWPHRRLLSVAALCFLALFAEGAMADWSALYLRSLPGMTAGAAATGYAAYSLAMAAGRFSGDWALARFGAVAVLRGSGAVSALGLTVALIVHAGTWALVGMVVVGLGLANCVPILFGAAGRDRELGPGPGIAAATTVGYLGFLTGPPLIGLMASLIGLRGALFAVALCGVAMSFNGSLVQDTDESPRK